MKTIDPTEFFGEPIDEILERYKSKVDVIEYSKTQGSEYVNFEEQGFFVNSSYGEGIVSTVVIYLEPNDGYFPASAAACKSFNCARTYEEFEQNFGQSTRDIPSIKIPGRPAKPSGRTYVGTKYQFNVSSYDGMNVSYVGISELST